MRILFVANKTIPLYNKSIIDSNYYNFYETLIDLNHEVYYYDTVLPEERDFNKVFNNFKPDLIFSIITGNSFITPYEPLEKIKKITEKGLCKTFNWFCDDTWRFDNFSKHVCSYFTVCSTPEPSYIKKYKDIGYNNIILGQWHVNKKLSVFNNSKKYDLGFCGNLTSERKKAFSKINHKIITFNNSKYEYILKNYSVFKIGLNLSVNNNDKDLKTQMKLRLFEITSANTLLLTQYTKDLEQFFEIDKEIVTFQNMEEANDKINFYLTNEKARNTISNNGFKRYIRDHTSQLRLMHILDEINKL